MKKIYLAVICFISISLFIGCGGSSSSNSPRFNGTDNEILAFSFTSTNNASKGIKTDVTGTINGNAISLIVPYGTTLETLIAEFVTNSKNIEVNGIDQQSGLSVNDFTNPVTYNVAADDGTLRNYTVTVAKALNSQKNITAYSINGIAGTINNSSGNISVTLPPYTDATSLAATFSFIGKSITVNNTTQKSGVTINDFTNPVVYTVTADDGSSMTYTVAVTVTKDSRNDITYFAFRASNNPSLGADVIGIINDPNIQCVLPYGSSPSDLVAYFSTYGVSVTVDGNTQDAGMTHNDFTNSKTYHVTAQDGTTKDYNVTVAVAKNDAKAITSFTLDGEVSAIDEQAKTITVQFASSKDTSALIATFVTTGVSVKIDGTNQISGTTANDFTNPVTYTVTADDGTTCNYTITAVKASSIAGLWNFDYGPDGGTISGTTVVPGINGNALAFNGLTDYVYTPNSNALTLADGGSIEALVNVTTLTPYAGIIHKGVLDDFSDETYSLQFWGVNGTDGTLRFLVHNINQDANNYTYVDSNTKLIPGKWYQIIACWDTTHLALYINGNKDAYYNGNVGMVKDSNGGLVIGAQMDHQYAYYTPWGDLGFNGIIDRVEIFSHSLTDDEALAHYQNFVSTAGPGFTAYLLSVVKHSIPYGAVVFAVILIALAVLYAYNRRRSTP